MRRTRTRGQALAEFAIVVPIFMLLLGGVIQFGIILWGQNTLNQVVRDAGRYAATLPTCSVSAATARVADLTHAQANAGPWTLVSSTVSYSDRSTVPPTTPPSPCPPEDNQGDVWVTIAASYDVPIFFPFMPGNGRLGSSVDFRVEPLP